MENSYQINCYTNYNGINNLHFIGLQKGNLSSWNDGLFFYFASFRYTKTPIPQYIKDLAKNNNNFYLVLEDCEEGFAYYTFKQIYEFVEKYNLQNKVVYATGHLEVEKVYNYWLDKKNLQKNFYVWSHSLLYHRLRDWVTDCNIDVKVDKNQWYSCMNNRHRIHRLLTVTYLDYLDLLKHGKVSANEKNYDGGERLFKDDVIPSIPRIANRYQEIIKTQVNNTQKKLPLVIDIDDLSNKCLPCDLSPKVYNNTLVNLVTETFYFPEYNFIDESFLTEKTYKAFTAYQIPVIIGPKGTVERLRIMGFDMFDDIVDHSYDTADDSERLFLAIESLKKLIENYKLKDLNLITKDRRVSNRKKYLKGIKDLDKHLKDVVCT